MTKRQDASGATRHAKPRITLTAADHERLSDLARATMKRMPDVASCLADELDRAHRASEDRHADHVVCMGSGVEFRDETTGQIQEVTLVYPEAADITWAESRC